MTFEELYNQLTEMKSEIQPDAKVFVTTYDDFKPETQELKGIHYYNRSNEINLFGIGKNE